MTSFTYLGSAVDKLGGTDADVKLQIGKARAAFPQLRNVWGSSDLPLNTKLRILVKPALLYGPETWLAGQLPKANPPNLLAKHNQQLGTVAATRTKTWTGRNSPKMLAMDWPHPPQTHFQNNKVRPVLEPQGE